MTKFEYDEKLDWYGWHNTNKNDAHVKKAQRDEMERHAVAAQLRSIKPREKSTDGTNGVPW